MPDQQCPSSLESESTSVISLSRAETSGSQLSLLSLSSSCKNTSEALSKDALGDACNLIGNNSDHIHMLLGVTIVVQAFVIFLSFSQSERWQTLLVGP